MNLDKNVSEWVSKQARKWDKDIDNDNNDDNDKYDSNNSKYYVNQY